MTLDVLIEQTNDDLKDLLVLFRDRVRWLYGYIVQGIVDTPGVSVSAARSAVVSAYAVQFTDTALSLDPGVCFDALVDRHGVGANATQKWSDFKNKILGFTDGGAFSAKYVESLESGTMPSVAMLKLTAIRGDMGIPGSGASDRSVVDTKDASGVLVSRTWSSSSLGYTVRETYPGPALEVL